MKPSTDSPRITKRSPPSAERVTVRFLCLLLGLSLLSVCFGNYPLNLFACRTWDTASRNVFFGLRLPRVLAGILASGVLGVTGAVCQTVFCNPLASPDITGVASGASFGAAAAILIGCAGFVRIGFAFVGGLGALALLLLLVRLSGCASPDGITGGNPVIFSGLLTEKLMRLTGDQGGKAVLRSCPDRIKYVICPRNELHDIDSPCDLANISHT